MDSAKKDILSKLMEGSRMASDTEIFDLDAPKGAEILKDYRDQAPDSTQIMDTLEEVPDRKPRSLPEIEKNIGTKAERGLTKGKGLSSRSIGEIVEDYDKSLIDADSKRASTLMKKAAKQGADLGSVAKKNVLSKVAKSGLKGLGRAASVAAGPLGLMASGVAEAASTEDAGQPMDVSGGVKAQAIRFVRDMDPERREAFIEANPKLKEMLASDLSDNLAAMKERSLLRGKDTLDRQRDMSELDLEDSRKEREGLQRKKEEQDRMDRSLDNVIEDPSSSSNLRRVLENIRNKQR